MSGLPCAKRIIDQRNAVVQVMDCMGATIQLYKDKRTPTEEMEEEFIKACNNLAKVAVKIDRYVEAVATEEESPPSILP